MENITKDLLDSILYEDTGEKSELHEYILEGIKPYLKKNIQLGGGITITTEDEIDDLFDKTGKLKEQYGGDLIKFLKRYVNISFFNRFYKKFVKMQNEFQPLADDINSLHEIVDKRTGNIKGLLGVYYYNKKALVQLNYILKKLPANDTRNIDQITRNIKKFNSATTGVVNKINIAYKYFQDEFNKRKFKILKLGKTNVDKYTVLTQKFVKFQDKIEVMFELFDKKYAALSAEIDELRVKKETIYTRLNDKFNKFNDERVRLNGKINRLTYQIGEIENIKAHIDSKFIDSKFNSYGNFDTSTGTLIETEITNIYNRFDNTIIILEGMKDNFKKLLDILKRLESTFQNFFNTELRDNKFVQKINEFIQKVSRCYHISEGLHNQFMEMKVTYATKDFPPPNLDNDFDMAEHIYKGIIDYFGEIQLVFSSFIQHINKDTTAIVIDNSTITKFIKRMNGLKQLGGNITQIGGASISNIDNNIIYLHTYDMYAVNPNNGNQLIIGGTKNLLNKQTRLRLKNNLANTSLHQNIVYNKPPPPTYDLLQKNVLPGMVMISQEIEYSLNHNIIAKFVNNIKKLVNKPRSSFLSLLYKGKVYTYIINLLPTGYIKVTRIVEDTVSKFTQNVSNFTQNKNKFKFPFVGEEYYGFIPQNILELHKQDLKSIKDDALRKQVEVQQRQVYIIPFFLKLSTLNYINEPKNKKKGNVNPNALYNYDIYLPIDTLFNKVLLPYFPVNISDYLVSKKTNNNYSMETLFNTSFNTPLQNVNFSAINPTELHKLTKYKYILFFTDNMFIYDNNTGNRYIQIDDKTQKKSKEIFTDYFNFYQSYINKIKILSNIHNVNSETLSYSSVHVNFMSGEINKRNITEYYNSSSFPKYVLFFKYIYYNIIVDIDLDILKFDKVEGIDDVKITSGPGNTLEKFIFDELMIMKEGLTDNLLVFDKLYSKIEAGIFKENITSIRESYAKLNVINFKDINLNIKKTKQLIPDFPGADEFYKTQKDNPDYPELKSTTNLKFMLKTFVQEGNFEVSKGSNTNIMVSIYPAVKQIGNSKDEDELQKLKSGSSNSFNVGKSYGAINKMLDTIITKEGAEQLRRDIIVFNQTRTNYKDYYKNTGTTVSDLYSVYNNEGNNKGKVFYKLNTYITSYLKFTENEDKLKEYITGGQRIFKEEYEQYEEKLKEQLKLEKEKHEKTQRPKYTNPGP